MMRERKEDVKEDEEGEGRKKVKLREGRLVMKVKRKMSKRKEESKKAR